MTGWNAQQAAAFLNMQFDAQQQDYRARYPDGRFLLVLADNVPAGRLYLTQTPDELKILDLIVDPPRRRQGIGTFLLKTVLEEAGREKLPVSVYVDNDTEAESLFAGHGFRVVRAESLYSIWKTPSPA